MSPTFYSSNDLCLHINMLRRRKIPAKTFLYICFYPVGNYMFKVNNRKSRPRRKICSKLTRMTPEGRQWHLNICDTLF